MNGRIWFSEFCKEIFLELAIQYNLEIGECKDTSFTLLNDLVWFNIGFDDNYYIRVAFIFFPRDINGSLEMTQLLEFEDICIKTYFYNGLKDIFVPNFHENSDQIIKSQILLFDQIIKSHFIHFLKGEKPIYYNQARKLPWKVYPTQAGEKSIL